MSVKTYNGFPDISLKGCVMTSARFAEGDVIFNFDENGVRLGPDHEANPWGRPVRTDRASMRLEDLDFAASSAELGEKRRFPFGLLPGRLHSVTVQDFMDGLSIKGWRFEITDELDCWKKTLTLCGFVTEPDGEPVECTLRLSYSGGILYSFGKAMGESLYG